MVQIKKITGDSGHTIITMSDGTIIEACSEFRAKSGKIDGVLVYKDSIKHKETGICLAESELCNLFEVYEEYEKEHGDFIDWI